MRKALVLLLIFVSFKTYAQASKKFKLIDEKTGKVIPFANVLFNDKNFKGTSTDIDGIFVIPLDIKKITISYVSYETKVLNVENIKNTTITLKPLVNALDEIVIDRENPAHRIIRLAVANKSINNPENLNAFTYQSYDKIIVTSGNQQKEKDSLSEAIEKVMNGSYFFITETIAKHKYLKPRFSEDSIIATKSSGFKSPNFALLANSFQPFSFYEEHIELFETNYLNPISKGSTRKYKFRLKDEYIKGKDTIFVISFEPKANRNFEGLKGLLQINSNKYAVQSVDAETHNSGKINVIIQQKYNFIKNRFWFPEQLNFEIKVGSGFGSIKYIGKSYLSKVEPNAILTKKDFPFVSITLPKEAKTKDADFWSLSRRDTLDLREKRTYVFIDSISEEIKLEKAFRLLPSFIQGRIPFKYIDIDVNQLYRFNKYEGSRVGLGIYTNDDVFKNVSIGGYTAYGFKDNTLKYGGEILVEIPSTKDITFNLKYINDVRETGTYSGSRIENPFVQRNWIASQMDGIKSYSVNTNMKLFRDIDWSVGFNTADVTPLYDYEFIDNGLTIRDYENSELNVGFSYHVNEKLVNIFGITTRQYNDAPVFNLIYSKGLNGVFNSDFSYNKLRFTLDHSFITKGLGKTTYRLDLGYIDKSLPYGLMFTGEGTYDDKVPFVVRNYFQTITPYEFLSDRYAHLFTTHNFGRLLNNKGYFQPDILLHNNLGIGNLSDRSNHQLIEFATKEELFLETGIELQNLIKLPFFEIGYFGIGVGGFYRYGHHRFADFSDNFVFKYSFGFSFK